MLQWQKFSNYIPLPLCLIVCYSLYQGRLISVFLVQPIDWALLPRAALGVLALLCGNGFIVGINQIYDVDVDTVNKPFLPVAAGKRA